MSGEEAERWLPVVGFEGSYEVSDHGNVRGLDRLDTIGRPVTGRVLVPTPNKDGYLTVLLSTSKGARYRRQVHRLVLEAFVGPCPDGMECCHGPDRAPANCRLDNLRWGTRLENVLDQVREGTHRFASKTHCSRGHPFEAPNLVPTALRRGRRQCLACNRAHSVLWNRPDAGDLQTIADQKYAEIIAAAESAA